MQASLVNIKKEHAMRINKYIDKYFVVRSIEYTPFESRPGP
jgi:hypothetical protein